MFSKRSPGVKLTAWRARGRQLSSVASSRRIFRSASAHVTQRPREQRLAIAHAGQAADDAYAFRAENVEINDGPLARADQLGRSHGTRAPNHLSRWARRRNAGPAVPRRYHPPLDVASAIDPGMRTCSPTARVTARPARCISSGCRPVAEAPTTSTPPSLSGSDYGS